MDEHVKNIFEAGGGGGMGGGLGAGLIGGVLGGALLGNRGGLLGNNGGGVEGIVTPTQLTAALAGVTETQNNTAIMGQLSAISAAIPYSQGQIQLGLAATESSLTNLGNASNVANLQGHFALATRVSDSTATLLASQNMINSNVMAEGSKTRETVTNFGVANLTATKDAQYANALAVAASTKEILAALNAQNTDNLQRQLTVAEQALLETRAESRARGTEVNVTQTVNQAQAQNQAQQQMQDQRLILAQLCAAVGGLQSAVATNSNMIIGNTGAVGTGPQTANPVNVRT